jgi:hypothetical protein
MADPREEVEAVARELWHQDHPNASRRDWEKLYPATRDRWVIGAQSVIAALDAARSTQAEAVEAERTGDGDYEYRGAPTHETDVDARTEFHPSGDTYIKAYAYCEQCDWDAEGDEGDVRGAAWSHEENSRPVTKLVADDGAA